MPKKSQSSQKKEETKEPEKKDTTNTQKKLDKKFSLSPEYKSMNQKYFPSKENFFGTKTSEKTNIRTYSPPTHSPIMNYYSSSLLGEELNFYSPKKNENNFNRFSPNFNYNPSSYFNLGNENIGYNDNKTLQEKIEPFAKRKDSNNFIEKNALYNMNINNEIKKEKKYEDDEEEEEEENNEQAFSLIINNTQPKDFIQNNKQMKNNNNNENNKIITNKDSNIKSNNENLKNEKNEINNIINKEFKPYIPNKLKFNKKNYENDFFMKNKYNIFSQNTNGYINYYPNINTYNEEDFYNNNMNIGQNQNSNFYYKGDHYQINNFKDHNKKKDYKKTGEIPSITQEDIVIAITSNNKIIRRIDPNTYLNESNEFLAHNIFKLGQDQAGCRFLQEKIESDPKEIVPIFFPAMLPYLIPLVKDPFGNYLVQKFFPHLTIDNIKTILKEISPNILDIGSNNHGTRVLQNIINYLSTPELVTIFSNIVKPHIIPLLKEMHGLHIINKLLSLHPEVENEIGKIILDNCPILAMHKHGCFFLQKILEGPERPLKFELIKNLLDICHGLIIDQFGNYVVQSILQLNISKYSSAIALLISESAPSYSKHRYSCNVVEKCFDFCGKKERNILIKKLSTPESITDLILDEHGNYVIQKVIYYADPIKREEIFKILMPLIPQIQNKTYGEKLLNKLYSLSPKMFNKNKYNQNFRNKHKNSDYNVINTNYNNDNYNNKFNDIENQNNTLQNKYDMINNNIINNNKNNNFTMNNYYNINNNTINININNIEKKEKATINTKKINDNENKTINGKNDNNNNTLLENKNILKKKKSKIKKKSSDESSSSDTSEEINNK